MLGDSIPPSTLQAPSFLSPPKVLPHSSLSCLHLHNKVLHPRAVDARQNQLPGFGKCVSDKYLNKISANILILGDQQQERYERVEQAKEKTKGKALATRWVNLINNKGDELMYKPVVLSPQPTITGGV